jgi:hypothetical protein
MYLLFFNKYAMRALGRRSISSFIKVALDGAWWLAAIALGLLGLFLIFGTRADLRSEHLTLSLPVAFETHSPARGLSASVPSDAQIEKLRGTLRFPVQNRPFFSASLLLVVTMLGFMLWVLDQLRGLFRELRDGRPFTAANAKRIRRVGLAVVAGELARSAIVYFWSAYLSTHFAADGLRVTPFVDLNVTAILSGIAILVIADVFRQGARLQDEQSFTI